MPIKPAKDKFTDEDILEALRVNEQTMKLAREQYLQRLKKRGKKEPAIIITPFVFKDGLRKRGRPRGSKNKK
jgi:hypothetical protein